MSYERRGPAPLKYEPVVYPGSVVRFRGPSARIAPPLVVCLGGSETFGRFIAQPYAAQLAGVLPCPVVNLGVMNAGLDVLMRDPAICDILDQASAIVLQVPGAANMTNRFYTVHPRRNDRFLRASTMLKTFFPEVDFTEFHFTRHLLSHLAAVSEERFSIVVEELQTAWRARMARFLDRAPAPVHLLWLSNRAPEDHWGAHALGHDPVFVSRAMLNTAARAAASLTVAVPETRSRRHATKGMIYGPGEEAAARILPGPKAHEDAAKALCPLLTHALAQGGAATDPSNA